jgi:drug/metabolite transporter (DMT)-like permease
MLCGCFATAWMGQFAHLLKDDCDWRLIALARSGVALLLALGLTRLAGARIVIWRPAALWLRGCASSVSLLCTFFALAHLPTSEVLTLTNTFPIWVAFLSWPMLGTAPTLPVWLAAICGVCGVAMIQSPHFHVAGQGSTAVALSLTAALTSAVAMLGLHRLKAIHRWAIVTHYSAVATLFVLGVWGISGVPELAVLMNAKVVLLLAATGVAATVGQVCVTKAFTSGAPARVSVVGLMQIIFAVGLDALFAGPSFRPITLAGITLVLMPTAWMMATRKARQAPGRASAASVEDAPAPTSLKTVPVGGE